MLVMNFTNYLAYYFDYLKHELHELGKNSVTPILNHKLHKILQKHRMAINLAHSLDENFRFILLITFIANIFIACFDMFRFIFVSWYEIF